MPELPEVETTVKGLRPRVVSRTITDVWSDWQKMVKKPNSFDLFKKEIKGQKIKRVWRRAKNVIFELSNGYSLLVHQKMTGHLLYGKWILKDEKWSSIKDGLLKEKINTFLHIIFFLDNGYMIALSDVRKFAKIELQKTENLLKELEDLGPEPLEKSFTFEKFKEALQRKKGKIKQILMKPEVIAGIGNIYASEALWQAKIHPEKDVSDLSSRDFKNLYRSIKKVLELGVKFGGESFSDYRKPDGSKGGFDSERRAYKREGQKCRRCGVKIKRIKFGGRSAFFCPNCQKM